MSNCDYANDQFVPDYPPRGDAAVISAMISEAKASGLHEIVIPRRNPGTGDELWIIEEAIRIPSGTRVILDGARLVLADGAFCNVFQNEHAWAEDRLQLSAEDHDIEIIGRNGATLDGGNYNGWGERSLPWKRGVFYRDDEHREAFAKIGKRLVDNSFIHFHNVKGFRVEGLRLHHQRYWACTFRFCEEGVIRDVRFEADISWVSLDGCDHRPNRIPGRGDNLYLKNGDGIDLRMGCHDILIENLSGWSEDDMLALTNLPGDHSEIVEGKSTDIHHVTVRNVRGATFIWFNLIRLLCADGSRIHDIDIDGVRDEYDPRMTWRGNLSAVQINDWSTEYFRKRQAVMGEVKDISIRNVVSGAPQPLHFFGPLENVNVENVHLLPGAHCLMDIMNTAEFKNVSVRHVTADESVKLCSLLDFVEAEGELMLEDVAVTEACHYMRNRGNAKVEFKDIRVERLTGEKTVTSDGTHVMCVELPEYEDLAEGL